MPHAPLSVPRPAPGSRARRLTAICAAAVAVAGLSLGERAVTGVLASGPEQSRVVARVAAPAQPQQRATATATSASWNPKVSCTAAVTTLGAVLGSQRGSSGGATFAGGGFRPGVPDRRSATPPCTVNGVRTFVELRNVVLSSCSSINKDGDWTCTVRDPAKPAGDMNRMHIETDVKYRKSAGWSQPPGNVKLHLQGFVYWDPDHTGAKWHNHSGWEMHSFTAWKRA